MYCDTAKLIRNQVTETREANAQFGADLVFLVVGVTWQGFGAHLKFEKRI